MPFTDRLKLVFKLLVFLKTPNSSGDKPELTLEPEDAFTKGKKLPLKISIFLIQLHIEHILLNLDIIFQCVFYILLVSIFFVKSLGIHTEEM